jgi:hypothetical protein
LQDTFDPKQLSTEVPPITDFDRYTISNAGKVACFDAKMNPSGTTLVANS